MSSINTIISEIKAEGHRLTKVRLAMLKILAKTKLPLNSATISTKLNALNVGANRTTVYRELVFLVENNIIKKIQFSDHKMYYEVCADHHHHLICNKCHKIQEIVLGEHLERQEKQIYKQKNFQVISHSLEFYGLCQNCR
jgi:Fur family ferric uptake transcriptional regulator